MSIFILNDDVALVKLILPSLLTPSFLTAATAVSDNKDESEIEFMDEDFHASMGMKRKYADTDPDSSTVSKKDKLNGKGESKHPPTK